MKIIKHRLTKHDEFCNIQHNEIVKNEVSQNVQRIFLDHAIYFTTTPVKSDFTFSNPELYSSIRVDETNVSYNHFRLSIMSYNCISCLITAIWLTEKQWC